MNKVAPAGGGAYWRERESILAEIIHRLKDAGWLSEQRSSESVGTLVQDALHDGDPPIMKGARFLGTIDVHAEMAAITDVVRHGVSTAGCTLYTTTLPCHDCTKHIVASGISRVVYVEPYRKSRSPGWQPR